MEELKNELNAEQAAEVSGGAGRHTGMLFCVDCQRELMSNAEGTEHRQKGHFVIDNWERAVSL